MSIQGYLDWQKSTRDIRAKGPTEIVSATQMRSYIAGTLINLQGKVEMPGGKYITIKPKMGSYTPAAFSHSKKRRTITQGDVLDEGNVRFCLQEKAKILDEFDIDFNDDNPEKYVDNADLIDKSFNEAIGTGMEQALFAKPDASMEGITGGPVDYPALSIPALFCPEYQGVPQGVSWGSTIGGISPTTWDNWRPAGVSTNSTNSDNAQIRYLSGSPFDENDGVYACMEKIWTRANFMQDLEGNTGHVKTAMGQMLFVTGELGTDKYRACCFARGEAYTRTDELGRYLFHGIPVRSAAIIDQTNLDFATSYASPYGKNNPAFWLLNANHAWIKFKSGHMWVESDPIKAGPELYNINAIWKHAFWQFFIPDDRRRCGVLVAA